MLDAFLPIMLKIIPLGLRQLCQHNYYAGIIGAGLVVANGIKSRDMVEFIVIQV